MNTSAWSRKSVWHILALCAIAFLISAGLRYLEAQRWDPNVHQIDSEYLLATHDAYAWVAGAEFRDFRMAGHPMSQLLEMLSFVTTISTANLAFWLPPTLAALSAIPITLWALHLEASPVTSLVAGALGTLAPAFYTRTRLGYYDTDWATLFFPLLVSWLMAVWIQQKPRDLDAEHSTFPLKVWIIKQPVLLLLTIPIGLAWHGSIRVYIIVMIWLALGLWVIKAGRDLHRDAIIGLLALTLAAGMGWKGAVVGLAGLLLMARTSDERLDKIVPKRFMLVVLVCILAVFTALQFREYLIASITHYFHVPDQGPTSLTFPDLSSSVRETQGIKLEEAFQGAAFQFWLGVLGLMGFAYTLIKRPIAVLLTPLLILGLLSPAIGIRFTMFASPVFLLGTLVPISWLIPERIHIQGKVVLHANALFIGALLILLPVIYRMYAHLPIEAVLDRRHAAGLRRLNSIADHDGLVWTWWDYGYATQYFAGMPTFADGGRNTGPYIFLLGRVLGSEDLAASAHLMAFTASHDYQPWSVWEDWDVEELDTWLKKDELLETGESPHTPQFLAVQFEAISFLSWIEYYGSWDFSDRIGRSGYVVERSQPRKLDLERGEYIDRTGQEYDLETADVFDSSGSMHYGYPENPDGMHLLIDLETADVYILDDQSYQTTLVRLLVMPADSFNSSGYFQLLIDDAPYVRIFKLKSDAVITSDRYITPSIQGHAMPVIW